MSNQYIYHDKISDKLYEKIERKALIINILLNFLLIISGITFYFLTKSSSILFDGVYSGIMTLTSGLALFVTFASKKKSNTFPFGKCIFEDIFSLFKNLLVLLVSAFFAYDAITSIIDITSNKIEPTVIPNILIYSIYISIVCSISIIIISIYYFMNKKIGGKSIIIKAEIKSSIIDFLISFSIGVALLISSFVAGDSNRTREIIDRSITIVLITSIIPFIIKSLFFDLCNISGKRLYRKEEKELIKHLDVKQIDDIYIKKHNKQRIIFIYIQDQKGINLSKIKNKTNSHIFDHYPDETNIFYILK